MSPDYLSQQSYYYVDANNRKCGPIGVLDFDSHGITATTLVWYKDLQAWTPAGSVPGLGLYLPRSAARTLPHTPADEMRQDAVEPPCPPYRPYGEADRTAAAEAPGAKPGNNLVWALLTTFLCCWPCGIVAIVKAAKVDPLWYAGEYEQAYEAAASARKWSIVSAVLAVGAWVLFVVFYTAMSALLMKAVMV